MSWARESNHKYIGEAFAALYMKGIFTSYAVRDYNFLSTVADLDAHQSLISPFLSWMLFVPANFKMNSTVLDNNKYKCLHLKAILLNKQMIIFAKSPLEMLGIFYFPWAYHR